MRTVEFLFDFGSPATYIAYRRLPAIAASAGASMIWSPVLLGGIFKATGNASPGSVPAKGAYVNMDLARSAARHAVPFTMNPFFPINTLMLMRGAAGIQMHEPERFALYLDAVFTAMWQDGRDMNDAAVVGDVLGAAGFAAAAFAALIGRDGVKDALRRNTEAAVARGVFGAPTMFVGNEMFFGQDRVDLVGEALRG